MKKERTPLHADISAKTLATLELNPEHFRMLRLAFYRGLTCDQLTPNTFLVSSSREGHGPYEVDAVRLTCPCGAASYCSHLALAVDRWYGREAGVQAGGVWYAYPKVDPDSPGDSGGEVIFEFEGDRRAIRRFATALEAYEVCALRRQVWLDAAPYRTTSARAESRTPADEARETMQGHTVAPA